MDDAERRTHAWFVQVERSGDITTKMFSDTVHGGKRKALQAAKHYRDELLADAAVRGHQAWRRSILRKNNKSGITGVCRVRVVQRQKSGLAYWFWMAQWVDEHGRNRTRKFAVSKYGEAKAKELAIAERRRQLRRVCLIKTEELNARIA